MYGNKNLECSFHSDEEEAPDLRRGIFCSKLFSPPPRAPKGQRSRHGGQRPITSSSAGVPSTLAEDALSWARKSAESLVRINSLRVRCCPMYGCDLVESLQVKDESGKGVGKEFLRVSKSNLEKEAIWKLFIFVRLCL